MMREIRTILLVEDSAADAEMMTLAIEKSGIAADIVVLRTGPQATVKTRATYCCSISTFP